MANETQNPTPVEEKLVRGGVMQSALGAFKAGMMKELKKVQDAFPTKISVFENDSNYATKEEVADEIKKVIAGAPENLDTLKELADMLDNDDEAAAGIVQQLAKKAPKADTLAGYGITDAKIEDGTIHLGDGTITPVTTEQFEEFKTENTEAMNTLKQEVLDSIPELEFVTAEEAIEMVDALFPEEDPEVVE